MALIKTDRDAGSQRYRNDPDPGQDVSLDQCHRNTVGFGPHVADVFLACKSAYGALYTLVCLEQLLLSCKLEHGHTNVFLNHKQVSAS